MSVSSGILKSYLKSRLCQNGRMTLPKSDLKDLFPKSQQSFKGLRIRIMEASEKELVKDLMLNNFYSSAIVPSALKLRDTFPKFQYLEDELDLMLDSEASIVQINEENDQIVGATINTVWTVDDSIEDFQVDPVQWLNMASEISEKQCQNDPLLKIVIWRDFQFQLIYHLIHNEARKNGAKYVLYGGMGFVEPEFRDRGGTAVFLAAGNQWASRNDTLFSFMGTFPGFGKMMERTLPGVFKTLAYIPYSELDFRHLSSEEKAFEGVKDGMILLCSK